MRLPGLGLTCGPKHPARFGGFGVVEFRVLGYL